MIAAADPALRIGNRVRAGATASAVVANEWASPRGPASDRIRATVRDGDAAVLARSKNLFSPAGACLIMSASPSWLHQPLIAWSRR